MKRAGHELLRHLISKQGFAVVATLFPVMLLGIAFVFSGHTSARAVGVSSSSIFRVGEKLSYTISFGKIPNAGYAETYVVSRGKIGGKDAVELRGKVKTMDVVSAAFFLFDESRTTFAAPDTGLPHYVTTSSLGSVMPKEAIRNYIKQSTSNYDLLTLIYKARESGGIGVFPLFEGDQMSTVSFQGAVAEKVRTEAGDFDTTVTNVQSEFLTANGLKDLRINFSTDEFRLPVLIRFKTAKGEFRASLTLITLPEVIPTPTPTPSPTPMPDTGRKPITTPKPTATPITYVDNEALNPELGFAIGEVLDYRVTAGGKTAGIISLNARERKLYEKVDSLLLTATVTGVEPGSTALRLGDSAMAQVDPETLTPLRIESKFDSAILGLNQTVTFDRKTGNISFGGKQPIDAPIGTQTFLSLIYAMRSFNLKPSKDPANPVNDTRVAVFWEAKSYVFTLRPSKPEEIMLNGETVSAQLISINTGNKDLDTLNIKVWLRTDDRVPIRFSAGTYQADLIQTSTNLF